MVSTRSQALAVSGDSNESSDKNNVVVPKDHSPNVTLMDYDHDDRGKKKRQKSTETDKANEVELQEKKKIFGSLSSTYVENGTKKGKKQKKEDNGEMGVTYPFPPDRYAPGEINSFGLRQPRLSCMGRGGGLPVECSNVEGPKLVKLDRKQVKQKRVNPQDLMIGLSKHTTNSDICSWPLQAVAQLAMKIDSEEFPLKKDHVTKCCPALLRSLIMQFRDDLVQHNNDLVVKTTISKQSGVFNMHTKEWEIEAYGRDDLRVILGEYMDQENLTQEKQKLKALSIDEMRTILYNFQDMILDAEVDPFEIHAQLNHYHGNVKGALMVFNQQMQQEENHGSSSTVTTMERDEQKENDVAIGADSPLEILQESKLPDISNDLSKQDGSLASDIEDEISDDDDNELINLVSQSTYCHMLSKDTHDMLLQGWSARVLLQLIRSRAKEHEMFLPFHLLKNCNPNILRRIVRDIRDDLKKHNADDVYESKISVNCSIFHSKISKWELKAYECKDLKIICKKFMDMSDIALPYDFYRWTKDKLVKFLWKTRKKMKAEVINPIQVHVKLEFFEGNVDKELAKLTLKYDQGPVNNNLLLTGNSDNDKINQWSPGILKQIIHIWNVQEKLKLNIKNLEALPASYLRGIVHQIRDELKEENKDNSLHAECEFWSTIHPKTKKWEIVSLSWTENKSILNSISKNLGKRYEVDDMTQEECTSCLMELIHSKEFQENKMGVHRRLHPKLPVTQLDINNHETISKKPQLKVYTLSQSMQLHDLLRWSPKVLIHVIHQFKPEYNSHKARYKLMQETTSHLRELVVRQIKLMRETNTTDQYTVKDIRQGFFSMNTLDWEINGYTQIELQDLLEQTRAYIQHEVPRTRDENVFHLKKELKQVRDVLLEKQDDRVFDLQKINLEKQIGFQSQQSRIQDVTDNTTKVSNELRQKWTIIPYSSYSKKSLINLYSKHYADVKGDQDAPLVSCIPILSRVTSDVNIGSWPPKQRMEILQQSGVDMEGMDHMELAQALRSYRNNMPPGKEISALTPHYGFFGRSSKDSILWGLSEIDIKRLYIAHCNRLGVKVTLQLFDGCVKREMVEEMQLIRALWIQNESYRFDLCIQLIHSGDLTVEQTVIQDVYTQIARRVKAADVQRGTAFKGKRIKKTDHTKVAVVESESNHIMGLTADWEIRNMSRHEAILELNYQCDLLHRDTLSQAEIEVMTLEEIIQQLFEFRKIHKRIYTAMNIPVADKETQEDLLMEHSEQSRCSSSSEDESNAQEDIDMEEVESDVQDDDVDNLSRSSDVSEDDTRHVVSQIEPDENPGESQTAIDETVGQTDIATEQLPGTSQSTRPALVHNDEVSEFKLVTPRKTKKKIKMNLTKDTNEVTPDKFGSESQSDKMDTSDMTVEQDPQPFWYLRAKMEVNTRSAHVPALLKKLVKVLRENDQSFQIFPFDLSSQLTSDTIIVHEDQFPDTVEYLNDWVRGIVTTRTQKLCFSLRITTKKSFRLLKEDIYDIINAKGWYVNFDSIQSESVYLLGWLRGLHPRCHRKEMVKQFIENNSEFLRNKIHVYFRGVWTTNELEEEVCTEALAIEGAYEDRSQIMELLARIQWNAAYGDVIFVPMQSSRDFTQEHILSAYGQQNTYLKTTYSKTVFLKENCILTQRNGKDIYFDEWISQKTINNIRFLQKAETYPNNSVRLIYHKDFESRVQEVMVNLYSEVCREFSKGIAERLLGPADKHLQKLAEFNKRSQINQSCAKAIESSRIKETKVIKMERPMSQHSSKVQNKFSYASVTTRNVPVIQQENHVPQKIVERKMENRIKELEAQVAQQSFDEKRVTATIQNNLRQEIEKTKKGIEHKMKLDKDETLEAIETTKINLEKKIDTKVDMFAGQLKAISTMLWETKEENEAQSSTVERMERNQTRMLQALEALVPPQITYSSDTPPISAVEPSSCHGATK